MPTIKMPLGKSWTQGRSHAANNMDILNYYPEVPSGGNRSDVVLLPTPGSNIFHDFGVAGTEPRILGASVDYSQTPDTLFIVAGDFGTAPNLFEVDFTTAESGTIFDRGTLTNFTGDFEVMIESNETYAVVFETTTGTAYVWDKFALTLTQITDLDYPPNQTPGLPLDTITYLDGYWVVSVRNSTRFYISNLANPLAWTATDFASAEQAPDPILRAFAIRNELWLFCKHSIEVWQNVGNPDFPFEPIPNAVFDVGVTAPLTVQNIGGALMFVSKDKSGHSRIMQANGFQLQNVSTQEVEYKLNNELNTIVGISGIGEYGMNVFATTHTLAGHSFYMITIPGGGVQNRLERYPIGFPITESSPGDTGGVDVLFSETGITLAYDLTSKLWHQRKSLSKSFFEGDPSSEFPLEYYFRFLLHANGSVYGCGGGDSTLSDVEDKLYRINFGSYVDLYNSTGPVYVPVVRAFISPYYTNNRKRVFWYSVELEVEQFVVDPNSDITEELYFDLYYSDNDGNSWKFAGRRTPQKENVAPNTIQLKRLKWNRLGYGRNRLYLVRSRTDSKTVILGMYATVSSEDEPGESNAVS